MMKTARWRRRVRRVIDMFEEERRLLRQGAIAELAAKADRRAEAVEELLACDPREIDGAEEDIARIRKMAGRSKDLLAAMLRGAAAAKADVERLARSGPSIGAYGADGVKLAQPAGPTRERRA